MSDAFKDFEATPVPTLVFGEAEKTLESAQQVIEQANQAVGANAQELQEAVAETVQTAQNAQETISPEALSQAVNQTIAHAGGGAAAAAAAAVADVNAAAPAPKQETLSDALLTDEERKQVDDFSNRYQEFDSDSSVRRRRPEKDG